MSLVDKIRKCSRSRMLFVVGVFLIVIGSILYLPKAFASSTPVKSIEITSSKLDYNKKVPGSYNIVKSAEWIEKGKARITFDLDTVMKTEKKYTDIIFVFDISGSMDGDKLNRVKQDSIELINILLSDSNNRAALITFETTSELVLGLTNNKNQLTNAINNLTTTGCTNYYQALVNVDKILKDYEKKEDRECIVLFLTDGYPNVDVPNEEGEYNYLKKTYPYLTIDGIQYEMGSEVLDPIKKVSDQQFIADMTNLNNVLFEASVAPSTYNEFLITDYIDNDYFEINGVDSIVATTGTTKLEYEGTVPKVIWNIKNLRSGAKATLTIDVNLKKEYIDKGGLYPTNKKEEVKSEIDGVIDDILSTKTPILSSHYQVIYDGNAPSECSVQNVPVATSKSVFETVVLSSSVPVCDGYQFKGWNIVTKNVKKVNEDYFTMPSSDVVIRASWGKMDIAKSIDGEVFKVQTLYKIVADQAYLDNIKSEFVSSSSGINFKSPPSNTNGKGVYTIASSKDNEYPVHYFRGEVTNNNVKFANICWKIVRTTETGGVKLIYNGVPDEMGECTNTTGEATQIGTSYYNSSSMSIADVGYMYGERYTYSVKDYLGDSDWNRYIGKQSILKGEFIPTYYYGDSVIYDEVAGVYTLVNANEYSWRSNYKILRGKYTCFKTTSDGCQSVSYVHLASDKNMFYVNMVNGETYESLIEQANNVKWIYGNDVEYVDGKYVLKNTVAYSPMTFGQDVKTGFNAHRYTCFTTGNTCEYVNYVYFANSVNIYDFSIYRDRAYYFVLQNGLKIDDIVRKMTTESTNDNSSLVKLLIDEWYQKNLLNYTLYLEDTVWCNDRSIYQIGVFDKDNKSDDYLYYGASRRNLFNSIPSVTCPNDNDKFTVNSEVGNGKLTYPIALLTADEVTLAGNGYKGYSKDTYLYTGKAWLLLSPTSYERYSPMTSKISSYSWGLDRAHVSSFDKIDVRPSVSLAPEMMVRDGNGTPSNPYEVFLPNDIDDNSNN